MSNVSYKGRCFIYILEKKENLFSGLWILSWSSKADHYLDIFKNMV